ncbi:hypothetical protein PHLCEN_2v9903 [Hermanssonia centrifuga]|uniref:F-box domain-containing protein n=1 Tax=Hermanssonia centrifuga TaxID=98765 RepID=A0A2R6NPH9_9APHY|nr:hypothetical protein PHLCEN_2v9903 [Hermanssonia centrifuga]
MPNELADSILDCLELVEVWRYLLQGDTATLRACSLVCRDWSFRSRAILHNRSVTFHLPPPWEEAGYDDLNRQLAQYESKKLSLYVREVTIEYTSGFAKQDWPMICNVLSRFESVHKLVLRAVRVEFDGTLAPKLEEIPDEILSVLSSEYSGLKSLHIEWFYFRNNEDFFKVLRWFRTLRQLTLHSVFGLHDVGGSACTM